MVHLAVPRVDMVHLAVPMVHRTRHCHLMVLTDQLLLQCHQALLQVVPVPFEGAVEVPGLMICRGSWGICRAQLLPGPGHPLAQRSHSLGLLSLKYLKEQGFETPGPPMLEVLWMLLVLMLASPQYVGKTKLNRESYS